MNFSYPATKPIPSSKETISLSKRNSTTTSTPYCIFNNTYPLATPLFPSSPRFGLLQKDPCLLAISSSKDSVFSLIRTSLANPCAQEVPLLWLNTGFLPLSFSSWVVGLRMPFSFTSERALCSFKRFCIPPPNFFFLSFCLCFFYFPSSVSSISLSE